jgi:hypothetical protein
MRKLIILIAFLATGMVANAQVKWNTTVEAGYEVGTRSSDFESNRFAGDIVESISLFNGRFQPGIGMGVRLYDDNSSDNNILTPVFLRLKSNILSDRRRINPYVKTDLGATWFPEYDWEYIGFMSSFGAGVDTKIGSSTLTFGLNYISQHYDKCRRSNAVGFVTGFTF